MRKFEILTLSDRNSSRLNEGGENVDPISIITAGGALLSQLFPGIFGGNRKRLTNADWLVLLPGSGYWTTALRNYLSKKILYDTDWTSNAQSFTSYFIVENQSAIEPGLPAYPAPLSQRQYDDLLNKFYALIAEEKRTGGTSPVGTVPGGYGGTIDYSTVIPLVLGGLAFVAVMKMKKTRKRK